jgi:hypothetical protein
VSFLKAEANFAMRAGSPRSDVIRIFCGVLRDALLEEHQAQIRVVAKFVTRLIKRCKRNLTLLPNVSHFRAQAFDSAASKYALADIQLPGFGPSGTTRRGNSITGGRRLSIL